MSMLFLLSYILFNYITCLDIYTGTHPNYVPFVSPVTVLVRYVRHDGKLHTVNLQNANLADGRTHSMILRVGGLRRDNLHLELYVDCRLADSGQRLPQLVSMPSDPESVDIRNGHKAYARLQVSHLFQI